MRPHECPQINFAFLNNELLQAVPQESVYFEVLKSWLRGCVATWPHCVAWPQIKFLSTYPHGSVALWLYFSTFKL